MSFSCWDGLVGNSEHTSSSVRLAGWWDFDFVLVGIGVSSRAAGNFEQVPCEICPPGHGKHACVTVMRCVFLVCPTSSLSAFFRGGGGHVWAWLNHKERQTSSRWIECRRGRSLPSWTHARAYPSSTRTGDQ